MSLVSGWFPPAVVVAALLTLVACTSFRRRRDRRRTAVAVAVAAALVGVFAALVDGIDLIPWDFPNSWYLWFGCIVLAPALGAVHWQRMRPWRRALPPVAFTLCVLMLLTLVNANYQYFPTTQSLFAPVVDSSTLAALDHLRHDHEHLRDASGRALHGATVPVRIPGTVSHFDARTAYVWTPPAFVDDPTESLPTIELLAGSPSSTLDWLRGGNADVTADVFAAAHGGVAPLLVMVDANGSETGDTECVDSPRGNAETYLTVDVPAFMHATFGARSGPGSTAIAGLSEGGMCSAMLALRHPGVFGAFGDYSGLAAPTIGDTLEPHATTDALFGGSGVQYLGHDPSHLLTTARFPDTAGWFEVGSEDPGPRGAQDELAPLARSAGVATCSVVRPGGHDFTFWTQAFRDSLPYLSWRLGLTPEPAGGACWTPTAWPSR